MRDAAEAEAEACLGWPTRDLPHSHPFDIIICLLLKGAFYYYCPAPWHFLLLSICTILCLTVYLRRFISRGYRFFYLYSPPKCPSFCRSSGWCGITTGPVLANTNHIRA